MPFSMSNVAIQQFHDNFTNVYQGASKLANTTQTVFNAVGDAYKWPVQGDSQMVKRGAYQSQIPTSDVNYEQVTTTFDNWVNLQAVDIFQQAELINDVLGGLGANHAKAAGRREDQAVIEALISANLPTSSIIADDSKNMTSEKIIEAASILDEQNVDSDDRFLIMTPKQRQALMGEERTTSIDYVNQRVLMNGELDTYMGFKIMVLGTRSEGGVPKNGNIRSCFAWNKASLGRAYSMQPSTSVEWDARNTSWLTITTMRLGASALLPTGIVEIKCDETA